ncbi:MAG: aldo/keto reductase [Burkholderiaceae bacterium]
MQYTSLGNTGLTVSVAGLGCGGNSRIGLGAGASTEESTLLREAFELGVTFFDTARTYGTEGLVGQAFTPSERDRIVLCTKSLVARGNERLSAAEVVANLEASLADLRTDRIDVFLLHGVDPEHYDHACEQLKPALLREQAKGKIRCLGLSETAPRDPGRKMLQRALDDATWQVFMLAYHMLNQGPRHDLFPRTRAQGVGTLLMFVVRNIFSRPACWRARSATWPPRARCRRRWPTPTSHWPFWYTRAARRA